MTSGLLSRLIRRRKMSSDFPIDATSADASAQTSSQVESPEDVINVVKIELMELTSVLFQEYESRGGYIIKLSELGKHIEGLIEGDGPDDPHRYMITPGKMTREKFDKLEDFGGW